MSYSDKTLTCFDCARSFGFTAEDQGIADELGFDHPVRCRACRNSRETARRRFGRDPVPTRGNARPHITFPVIIPAQPAL